MRLAPLALAVGSLTLARTAWAAPTIDLTRTFEKDGAVWVKNSAGAVLRTTLDPDLQRAAQRLLASASAPEAAIVASDPRSGRILAWASTGKADAVTQPHAPHASVFKLATASSLLGKGVGRTQSVCVPPGGEHGIEQRQLDAPGTVCMSFEDALAKSQNLVFARLAQRHLLAADVRKAAADLGLSGPIPIDVSVPQPTADVPDAGLGFARASAGFWSGKASPLGVLLGTQTIANDGERLKLWVLEGPLAKRSVEARALKASVAKDLRQMMQATVSRGTCAKAFAGSSLPKVAAKTGTLVGGTPSRMYSWFTGFAPADRPEIAVTVMLANDLVWRTKANLVGRQVLEAHFAKPKPAAKPPPAKAAPAKASPPSPPPARSPAGKAPVPVAKPAVRGPKRAARAAAAPRPRASEKR